MSNATSQMQPPTVQPLAIWNATRGIWEKPQLDLFEQQEQFWEPTALFRTPLASDAARGGESLQQVKARRGTIALSHQIIDLALHGPNGYPGSEESESLWRLIEEFFDYGDVTPCQ